jgi:hypothetical protein
MHRDIEWIRRMRERELVSGKVRTDGQLEEANHREAEDHGKRQRRREGDGA